MMMSPLNILSTTAPEVTTSASSVVSRSPESVCSAKSISPPVGPSSVMPASKDSSSAAAAAAAASAASLIHAFASANPQLANPSALAQMFPGFPLHMAAAFAGYANQSANHASAAAAGQHAPNPCTNAYGALYAQVQQQQLSSLISQAARQHHFMAMQSGKKLVDFDPTFPTPPPTSKLSPSSMHPPPPPNHHLQSHSPTSNGLYNRNVTGQSVGQHSNPLMPLTMMAKGQSSPNTGANASASSGNNSSNSSSGSAGLLSPILFSPLSASSASDSAYKRKLALLAGPNEASEVPNNSNSAANSDSAFSMANFQRLARQSPGSSAAGNLNGAFVCPLCNESLDGVDLNAHFYEELHKIDSLRKMAVWSSDDDVKKEISPYEKFGSSYCPATGSSSTSYQKKLQLPQSRWETFQRIRQNRHQRLSAFMRFTRRKYETAYESIAAAASASQHSPLGAASNVGHLAAPPIPTGQQGQGQSLGPTSAMAHHFHHSPSSSSTSSSSATAHRSPSTMATSTISPHHSSHHGGNHFEHHGHSFNSAAKMSSSSVAESQQTELGRNSSSASLNLAPPTNASSGAYAGQHPMFAQNAAAAFLHPGLPFYQSAYHAAAAAAAAQLQSSPTAATGPWSVGAAYSGFPNPADHFPPAFVGSSATMPNGAPKIWRTHDTEQPEAALSITSQDGLECSNKRKTAESDGGKKTLKKEVDDHGESIDVCSEANQAHSRCSSNVSGGSSHGGDDECTARHEDDSNERQTPPVTAVSEDSNHSAKACGKGETGEEAGEQDDLESNHSSRGQQSEAEEENRASEGEEDDVDVVSSDSEANHVPAKARSQKRPSSPFDSPTYPSKHRFSHGQLYHHNNHNHRHHSSDFHFTHSLIARSDSVGSGTETTPVS